MNAAPVIRDETAADTAAVTAVTVTAFADLAAGNPTEQFIIEALRVARMLTVSLVAELRRMKVRSIQLMDAKGQVPFYAGPGFSVRPDDGPGMQFSGELPRENTAAGGQLPVTDL